MEGGRMKRQTKLALAGAGTALVLVIGGAGIASASGDSVTTSNPLSRLLSSLVGKGTITQSQANAIITAADEMRGQDQAAHDARRTAKQKVISDTLGLQWSDIQSRLRKGDSLATIAGAKKDALIAALVAFEKTEIDADVKAGRLTADQATQIKTTLVSRVTDMVSGKRMGGHMHGRGMDDMRPRGMGDMDGDDFGGHHGGMGFGPDGWGTTASTSPSTNG